MSIKTLQIKVVEIKGRCSAYNVGDEFEIRDGFRLITLIPLCMHSLASLMPYYVALSRGIKPKELDLAKKGEIAYVQCLDPCGLTGGGTVVFEVKPCLKE